MGADYMTLHIKRVYFYLGFLYLVCFACGQGEVWAKAPLKLTKQALETGVNLKTAWGFKGPDGKDYAIQVPGSWEGKVYKRFRAFFGKGIYTLELDIPKSMVGKDLQLHSRFMLATSLRVYADGKLVGHNGFYEGSPSKIVQYYPFRTTSTRLSLRIELTNNVFHISGLLHPVWIGTKEVIQKKNFRERLGWHLFLGIFIFLFIFHILLYLFYRKDEMILFFALTCLFTTIRVEFFAVHGLEYFFGEIPVSTNVVFARIGIYGVAPTLMWYIRSLTHDYIPAWIPRTMSYLAVVFSCSAFFSAPIQNLCFRLWFLVIFVNVLYGIYLMFRLLNRPESRFFVVSSLLFSLTAVNDVLHGINVISTGFYARFGFFFFCFGQAGYIAWRNQQNRIASVRFAQELEETNQNLEVIIDERTQEVREKNKQLNELMQFKEDSVKMLVHDLKSPLSAFLQTPGEPSERSDSLQSASLRMKTLIESMLQVNQSEQVALTLQKGSFHLNALSQKVLSLLSPIATARAIHISNQVPSELELEVDGLLMERVLQNILENALKFAPEGSEIELRCSIQHGDCLLEILDQGPGMSPEIQAKAFEKQRSFGKGRHASTGLGLYFCREVILAHGGDIRLVNRVTGGTNVQIKLPLVVKEESAHPLLAEPEKVLLTPFAEALHPIEVYEISKLQPILKKLTDLSEPNIVRWTKALQTAIKEVDEASYQELIHQVPANIDH